MTHRYDISTAFIPSLHQPSLVLDHAADHDVPAQQLLAGTRLSAAQFATDPVLLSPAQWLQLLARSERALAVPDTAFVLGRRMMPGHFGAASHALQQAGSLRDALEVLVRHPARLSPLLTPRLVVEDDVAVLLWTDAVGLGGQRSFVVDMTMTAVAAMAQWLGGERLAWTFCFNRVAPRRPEQHEAFLGTDLRFGCHVDAMIVPRDALDRPWPRAGAPGAAQARQAAERAAAHEGHPTRSSLAALHDQLLASLPRMPGLDHSAALLGISPATLKRRLAAEGTHYQAELDLVRSHMALYYYRFRRCDNAAVARHLGFHDVPNFRRSFKRWTGLTPQLFREGLGAPA